MLEIRTANAARGLGWFVDGFNSFQPNISAWVGISILMLFASTVSGLFTLAGLVMQLLFPAFMGGLMLGCREAETGGKLKLDHLFAGFKQDAAELVLFGVINTILMGGVMALMVITIIMTLGGMTVYSSLFEGNYNLLLDNLQIIMIIVLIALLVTIPLLMTLLFGPALIVFNKLNALQAMKVSLIACVKNSLPFLVYGIVGLVLSVLATLPLLLGWIVLIPVSFASIYFAYKDIFPISTEILVR